MPVIVPLTAYASTDSLVKRVRKLLEDEPFEDTLAGSMSGSATAINLTTPASWAKGDILEFDDATGEQNRIQRDTPNNTAGDVKRGHNDTTAAAHSLPCVVLKNPRFTYDTIQEALTRIGLSLFPRVYGISTTAIVPVAGTQFYAMPSDFVDLIGAGQVSTASVTQVLPYGTKDGLAISIQRNIPTAQSSSNIAAIIPSFWNTTNNVTVFYRTKLTASTIPDDDTAECVVMGACYRLVGAKEVPAATNSKGPSETNLQPGSQARQSTWFEARFMELRDRVAANLRRTWPPARVWMR